VLQLNHKTLLLPIAAIMGAVAAVMLITYGGDSSDAPGLSRALVGHVIPGSPSIALAAPLERPASATFLDSEAGMAAYADTGASINLSSAKRAFKLIESEQADFIIGVVQVPALSGPTQPRVFVHKNGWMVAYFLRDESVRYTWPSRDVRPPESTLTMALDLVAGVAGFARPATNYYHFKFPSANRVAVIVAAEVLIPTTFQVFEPAGIKKGEFIGAGLLIVVHREP
jgi:hypothetical protein